MTDRTLALRCLSWGVALVGLACSWAASSPAHVSGAASLEGHSVVHRPRPAELRRVLVLPFNVLAPLPVALIGLTEPVVAELAGYLEAHDFEVVVDESDAAHALWLECQGQAQDPASGEHVWSEAGRCLVRRLGEQRSFDGVVLPTLFLQRVQIRAATVEWDGVTREIRGFERRMVTSASRRRRATVTGVSLHAIVLGDDGEELFHGVGGLEILLEVATVERRRQRVHWRVREDLFQDAEPLREGISITFDPFLPRSEASPPQTTPASAD